MISLWLSHPNKACSSVLVRASPIWAIVRWAEEFPIGVLIRAMLCSRERFRQGEKPFFTDWRWLQPGGLGRLDTATSWSA